ncbi:divalent-cation tolerance protein CutA [Candidatus Nitronereus thalassa]|uniref:Divalent-cation tolerance protein CutA n=1 Tax=Candidatus Nitronereus thalassa TaxID=3020898 RepID=A0ABU3K6L5_9BACT|nr:divalent-cation tolerance protein CutA [Candidatus Nitronereus thalassa]MDT7042033.1 divalent-cation tolerance protein CutA [Candidatus Nitronereus thalassa]
MDAIVVFVTTSSEEEAAALAKLLVAQHLVACVNVLPKVKSFFQWEGKISEEEEYLMILKTRMPLFNTLKKAITAQHSYDVPEIIALPIVQGSESYLSWIQDMTNKSNNS